MDVTPLADLLAGSPAAVLQALCHRGGMSLRFFGPDGEPAHGPSGDVFGLLPPLEAELRPASEQRPMTLELFVDGQGKPELSHTFELESVAPARVILDTGFRLPRHPVPGTPVPPGNAVADRPTDPAVLARVTALVKRFPISSFSPGYSEEQLLAAETGLGVRLPEDLRALYRNVGDDEGEHGLLGAFNLYSLDSIHPMDSWHDSPFTITPVVFEPYPSGHVKRLSRNDFWLTIAGDYGGNYCASDLDPAPGGRTGQLIEYGRGIYGPFGYIAGSVTELLTAAVEARERGEQRRPGHAPATPFDKAVTVGGGSVASVVTDLGDPLALQELYLNDAGDLDLAELAGVRHLRRLSINRAARVDLSVPHDVPVEALSIDAASTALGPLAGHPALWHLTLKRLAEPVCLRALATLSELTYLDLSGATVTDLEVVASLPRLRVLALTGAQWDALEGLDAVPKNLAAAELSGYSRLGESVAWASRRQRRASP
jgi:cell wall assembly regulator SMI1